MTGTVAGLPLEPLPHPCAYLPGRAADFEHYQLLHYDDDAFCTLLENGFRHFGAYFFRPLCPGLPGCAWCGACVPLRVPVATFEPTRSQRRAARRAAHVTVEVGEPRMSDEKFALYTRHKTRFAGTTRDLGLPADLTGGAPDPETFEAAFYGDAPFTRECTYRLDGRLVGVGHVDVASRVVSSIYFFYDPDLPRLSLGTASVLREIELARDHGASHYYLGYLVRDNPSMRYKAGFRPHELFDGRIWRPGTSNPALLVAPHGPFLTPRPREGDAP